MKPYVLDTLNDSIGTTLIKSCQCEVGYDIPFGIPVTKKMINAAWRNGYKWIYIDIQRFSPEIIEYAHSIGLRVLVYTVNSKDQLRGVGNSLPDAIITDHAELLNSFSQLNPGG